MDENSEHDKGGTYDVGDHVELRLKGMLVGKSIAVGVGSSTLCHNTALPSGTLKVCVIEVLDLDVKLPYSHPFSDVLIDSKDSSEIWNISDFA